MEKVAARKSDMTDKGYPWNCGNCGQEMVYPVKQDYSTTYKHDGKLHELFIHDLEIPTCRECSEQTFGVEQSDKVTQTLREKIGLLFPYEIKQRRTELMLSQEQLGVFIGVAKESISRWETGALIQSVSSDKLLRAFFDNPLSPIWTRQPSETLKTAANANRTTTFTPSILSEACSDPTYFESIDFFRERQNSVETLLLSQLMFEESKFLEVESRISELDFHDVPLRCTFGAMKSVYRKNGKLTMLLLAEVLTPQLAMFPITAVALIVFLTSRATPEIDISKLIAFMARRSEIQRELSKLP